MGWHGSLGTRGTADEELDSLVLFPNTHFFIVFVSSPICDYLKVISLHFWVTDCSPECWRTNSIESCSVGSQGVQGESSAGQRHSVSWGTDRKKGFPAKLRWESLSKILSVQFSTLAALWGTLTLWVRVLHPPLGSGNHWFQFCRLSAVYTCILDGTCGFSWIFSLSDWTWLFSTLTLCETYPHSLSASNNCNLSHNISIVWETFFKTENWV